MHCSSDSTAQGPATRAMCFPPTRTSPDGVGILRTVSSSFASRLTSLYGLLTGMHSTTPDIDSSPPKSIEPLLPVMPMAVRSEPGIGCAFRPRDSIRLQTARICASVACDCMTINMKSWPSFRYEASVRRGIGYAQIGSWEGGTPSPCFSQVLIPVELVGTHPPCPAGMTATGIVEPGTQARKAPLVRTGLHVGRSAPLGEFAQPLTG